MTSTTCQELTKAGNPCKGTPLPNSDYCRVHQPEDVDETTVPLCGHVNAHYIGEGDMTCDLPKGHEGAHSAVHYVVDWKEGGIVWEGDKRTYWTNEAGTPVDQIQPDIEGLKRMQLERKLAQMAE